MVGVHKGGDQEHLNAVLRDIADQIVDVMDRQQGKRSQLAKLLNVSKGRVSVMLRGDNNFTIRTLTHIASILGHEIKITLRPKSYQK